MIKGRVSSIQTLGALDGPGIRFVVFMQGCNLRCGCCHNPETWSLEGGTDYSSSEILEKVKRYKSYFGSKGGITISGGEPLLQAEFVYDLFSLCHQEGINTCLDTSGSIINENVIKALGVADRVLLDIKYENNEDYKKYVGCTLDKPLDFLKTLDEKKVPTTLRAVIIPTLNDNKSFVEFLNALSDRFSCVDKVELLPFKKICTVKYDDMNLYFRFKQIPEPQKESIEYLNSFIKL